MPTERFIENNVRRNRAALGYRDALSIRRCRMGAGFGVADLVILPERGPHRLVIIEAKQIVSQEAAGRVIGQLLLYYTGARQLGARGLRHMKHFAACNNRSASSLNATSLKMLSGGIAPRDVAWAELQKGRKLRADQIRLLIALDGEPRGSLKTMIELLHVEHGIDMGVVSVLKRDCLEVWTP